MDVDISIGFKRLFISIAIFASFILIPGCRPPATLIRNNLPILDTMQVIQISKRHHAYWTEYWVSPPAISFDEKERTWTVHSVKTEHTNRGECKHTNGCTVVKSVTLVIDDKKDKVVSKTKEKKIFPNYE